jgi:hypothetical protein
MRTVDEVYGSAFAEEEAFESALSEAWVRADLI